MIFLANGGTLSELELRVLYMEKLKKADPHFFGFLQIRFSDLSASSGAKILKTDQK